MPSDSDAWPDEPDENHPEDRWGDPETELVNVPGVDVPVTDAPGGDSDGGGEAVDIDRELATTFWAAVVLVNVGVAGVSIGAMLAYFRGELLLGGGAVVVGALALVRAYYTYRGYRDGDAEADSDSASVGVAGDADDHDAADAEATDGSR